MDVPKLADMSGNLFTFEDGSIFSSLSRRRSLTGKPLCITFGCDNVAKNRGKNHGGYMRLCESCYGYRGKKSYRNYKLDYCENVDGRLGFRCTTAIVDRCMLTVDHIDNNHFNHIPENCQTLCASCHNYKTKFFGHLRDLQLILEIMAENCLRTTGIKIKNGYLELKRIANKVQVC